MKQLLKFSRPGCVPCQMVENYLKDKKVSYQEVNVYEDPETANKYSIQSVPVLILLDDKGEIIDQSIGYNPLEIDKIIDQL